jgi:DNA replication protein DnaC
MEAPVGHPNFGRLIPCSCREQLQEERRIREYRDRSGLDVLESWAFDNFDTSVPGVRDAFEICYEYAQNPDGWLLLMGLYGSGKTHLAAAIAGYTMQNQRMFPLFTVVPDLLDHLRAAYAPDRTSSYDERFNEVRNAGLLVLDDLGTEYTTAWANEKLFQIINYRYYQRRPTVFTTNRELDSLDPRVASRLKDPSICTHIFIDAPDYRERGLPPSARRSPTRPRR